MEQHSASSDPCHPSKEVRSSATASGEGCAPALLDGRNHVLACLMGRRLGDTFGGMLRPVDTQSALSLQSVAQSIAEQALDCRSLLFTTGMGLPRVPTVPFRLPALLIPGLKVMESFVDRGREPPHYLVYQATEFIARMNDIRSSVAARVAMQMYHFLQRYVEVFHQRVARHVHFAFARGLEIPSAVLEEVVESTRALVEQVAGLRNCLISLEGSEVRHSNSRGHVLQYVAANAVCSRATGFDPFCGLAPYSSANGGIETERAVIPIGGFAERPFFAVTAALARRNGRRVFPVMTALGSRPTYYPYPELGDPLTLDEYARALSSARDFHIRKDIKALRADGATPEAMRQLFSPQDCQL